MKTLLTEKECTKLKAGYGAKIGDAFDEMLDDSRNHADIMTKWVDLQGNASPPPIKSGILMKPRISWLFSCVVLKGFGWLHQIF